MDKIMSENVGDSTKKNDEYYRKKYKRLRKTVIEIVHQNGALCEEIARTEDKISTVKAERKYLLKKLMQYEKPNLNSLKSSKGNKSQKTANTKVKKSSKTFGEGTTKTGQQKAKCTMVNPIQVDNNGRPIFPIEIGDLSVYSIGEIVHDRPNYHNRKFIFPVGYCSTRSFNSISSPESECLYTCKIFDDSISPRFEISPEDAPEITFLSQSISEVYASFLLAAAPQNPDNLTLSEYDFFGLSHPIIQNLIQSLPGASECSGYEWKKFEVVRPAKSSQAVAGHQNLNADLVKTGKSRSRQSDINIEALEKWARDLS
ncbi:transforming growth factor beta regulator 1-like [Styela clava]